LRIQNRHRVATASSVSCLRSCATLAPYRRNPAPVHMSAARARPEAPGKPSNRRCWTQLGPQRSNFAAPPNALLYVKFVLRCAPRERSRSWRDYASAEPRPRGFCRLAYQLKRSSWSVFIDQLHLPRACRRRLSADVEGKFAVMRVRNAERGRRGPDFGPAVCNGDPAQR
jgi:hypothetical protein